MGLLLSPAQTIDVLSALQCLISLQARQIRGFNLRYPYKITYKILHRTYIYESHLNCA